MTTTETTFRAATRPVPSPVRAAASVLVLALVFFSVMTVQTQDRAHALAPALIPDIPEILKVVKLPPGLVVSSGASVISGDAAAVTVIGAGATVTAPAWVPVAATAAAGLAIGYGITTGFKALWHWGSGHTSTMADPPGVTTVIGGTWVDGTDPGWHKLLGASYGGCSNNGYALCEAAFPSTMSPSSPGAACPGASCYYAPSTRGWAEIVTGPYQGATSGTLGGFWHGPGMAIVSRKLSDNSLTTFVSGGGVNSTHCYASGAPPSGFPPAAFSITLTCPSGYVLYGIDRTPSPGTTEQRYVFPSNPVPTGTNVITTTPTSRCTNTTTAVASDVAGPAVTYTAATADAALPALEFPACPSGTVRTGIKTPTTAPGVGTVPPPMKDLDRAAIVPSGFADCNTLATSCQLVLTRVFVEGNTKVCNNTGLCAGWQTKTAPSGPAIATQTGAGVAITERLPFYPDGSHLECKWGTYLIVTSECTAVPTEPYTPEVPVADPTNDPDGDCRPTGWGMLFNPLGWIYKPVKCALVWAFVPSPEVTAQFGSDISEAWNGTAPAVISDTITDVVAPITGLKDDAGATDCQGPSFVIPQLPTMPSTVTLHPMSTCNELTTYLLGIYLPIATALIYVGGFFAGTRVILKAFNLDTDEAI